MNQHGEEADRHLFRCLFSHVDFSGDGRSSGKDFHQVMYFVLPHIIYGLVSTIPFHKYQSFFICISLKHFSRYWTIQAKKSPCEAGLRFLFSQK